MKISNELTLEWLRYMEDNQFSENTIENYFTDVKFFLEYIKSKNQVKTVSSEDLTLLQIE